MPSGRSAREARGRGRRRRTNPWTYCLSLGFFAGLFWSVIHWIAHTLKFTVVIPGYLAEPFFRHSFLITGWGTVVGMLFFVVFSIAAAYLYFVALGRLRGPVPGLVYGAAWWGVVTAAGPATGMMKPVRELGWDTVTTQLCLYLLWGLFIGYSIAFEFNDEAGREPASAR